MGERSRHQQVRTGALVLVVTVVGTPLALFGFFRFFPDADALFHDAHFHVAAVGGIAAAALVVAALSALAAGRVGEHPVVYLAVGCLGVGVLMLAHGLTTPGALGQPMNRWVARLPTLGIATFTACMAATLAPPHHPIARLATARPGRFLASSGFVLVGFGAAVVAAPAAGFGGRRLAHELFVLDLLALASGVALAAVAVVYWRRWLLARDHLQFAMVLAAGLCISALVAMKYGRMWHLSWWDYHAFLLVAFGAAVTAIAREYGRSRTLEGAMRPIVTRDPFEQIASRYTQSLRPLVAAVEVKDAYTHGHSARVAEFATRLGIRMGLDQRSLRAVAEGAYLHDIGKIGIPDAILGKQGPLTPEERRIIEQHSIAGVEIASKAESLAHALPVIRAHHERWDGRGYPDGVGRCSIPLVARIAAVADVWDALTSDRAYRDAWSQTEALAHVLAGRGLTSTPTSSPRSRRCSSNAAFGPPPGWASRR